MSLGMILTDQSDKKFLYFLLNSVKIMHFKSLQSSKPNQINVDSKNILKRVLQIFVFFCDIIPEHLLEFACQVA